MTNDSLKQYSAGGVVYRQHNSQINICFIKDSYGAWTFPKGHIENGESPEQAAKREIAEETGIPIDRLELKADLGEISYWFTSDFARDKIGSDQEGPITIHKNVCYYLFEVPYDTKLSHQIEEVEAADWVPLAKIDEMNGYEDNLPIVTKTKEFFRI